MHTRALLATDHIVNDPRCLVEPDKHEPTDVKISTGTGATTIAKSRGPATFVVKNMNGKRMSITRNVLYCPDFNINLSGE